MKEYGILAVYRRNRPDSGWTGSVAGWSWWWLRYPLQHGGGFIPVASDEWGYRAEFKMTVGYWSIEF